MNIVKNLIVAVVILNIAWGCSSDNGKSDAYGNFEADEILISSESNGKIIELRFDEGEKLQKGQLLCVVDTVALHLQRNQLIASRKAADVGLDKVRSAISVQESQKKIIEKDVARVSKMIDQGAATQKQYDDVTGQLDVINQQIINTKTQLEAVNAEVAVIESKIASLNDQIRRCKIMAPTNGVVLVKLAEEGEITTAGKPVLKMASLDNIYLRAYVSGDELPHIKLGQNVTVLIDKNKDENQSLKGSISWISATSEFTPKIIQTKKERVEQVYAIKVKVTNDGTLKIGMPGEVVFSQLD